MLGEGEQEMNAADLASAYHTKPLLSRMAIVAAGPFTNFILGILMFWILFMMGVQQVKPIVGQVIPHSIAAKGGIQSGDELQRINGLRTQSWQSVLMALIARMGDQGKMVVKVLPKDKQNAQTRYLQLNNWSIDQRNPQLFKSLGMLPYQPKFPAVIETVASGSAAEHGGLQKGDRIITVNGKEVSDWMGFVKMIQRHPDQSVSITIARNQQRLDIKLQTAVKKEKGKTVGYLGVSAKPPAFPPDMIRTLQYSFFSAWTPAFLQSWKLTYFNYVVLKKMIFGKISIRALGGPITIFRGAGQASRAGLKAYLGFVAFISITLFFINILPIPGLDGGHLFFQVIEGVFRRPVPEKYQALIIKIGIILLILLIIQATINDILRLF